MEEIQAGLRGVVRFFGFNVLILSFLTVSYWIHFTSRGEEVRLRRFSRNVHFFCGLVLKAFNIKLKVVNKPQGPVHFLMVSNHMGFVDILINGSLFPMSFVTSMEMRETPFLGLLTEMGGCIYVERRNRSKILDELKGIAETIKKGFSVVLYPEATSTNGEQVLPFKKTLIMAAAYAGVPIQPVVVNFRKVNGEDFTIKWRDHLCWYGDIPFYVSLWKALQLKELQAEVEFLEQIHPTVDDDRGVIAERAHAMISAKFVPVKA